MISKRNFLYYASFLLVCMLSFLSNLDTAKAEAPILPSQTRFPGITLDAPLPKQFFLNEYYLIKGSLDNPNLKSVDVLLQEVDGEILIQETFAAENGNFEVTLGLLQSGRFLINLSPGKLLSSAREELVVSSRMNRIETTGTKHSPPSNMRSFMEGNQSFLSWKNRGSDNLNRLTFKQGSNSLTLYSSNNVSKWQVDYALFENFEAGEIEWILESAYAVNGSLLGRSTDWSRTSSRKLNAGQHHFAQVSNLLKLNKLSFQSHRNGAISLSGTCSVEIENAVRIITPSGKIETFELKEDAELLSKDEPFSFNYTFREEGSYFLEISNQNHLPVLNVPIYVGNIFPMLPDPIDLNAQGSSFKQNTQLMAVKMLNLINKERVANKLTELTFDPALNKMAITYSNEIADSGNFSHLSLDNKNANQRRLDFDILTPVGENLAQARTLEEAHYLLMRSATHRANMLDKRWERAGIGISFNSAGFLLVVQEFSVRSVKEDPLSTQQLQSLRKEIIESINQKRRRQGLEDLVINYSLENMLNTALYSSRGDSETTLLRLSNLEAFTRIKQRLLSLSIKSHFTNFAKVFSEHERVTDSIYQKIAISIYQDKDKDNLSAVILLER